MTLEEELIHYLQKPGFDRFIEAWIDKYRSRGHIAGKIKLEYLTDIEKQALSNFLGLDTSSGKLELSANQLNKFLKTTKFENVEFVEVIKNIKDHKIYTKKEIRDQKEKIEQDFKTSLLAEYRNTKGIEWLNQYFETDLTISRYIKSDMKQYYITLSNILNALDHLPVYTDHFELLAVFSQKITKDPHFFDSGMAKELLIRGICCLLNIEDSPQTIENYTYVLSQAGILKDDLSNYCYICHIMPKDHTSWKGFYEAYEPWNMNLYNLNEVSSAFEKSKIYVFENPSVFRNMCQEAKRNKLNIGLICGNGQINLCTYLLLDRLVESGCHLYYAGDFDPEGLLIANKLKVKYNRYLTLWGYSNELFSQVATKQKEISNKRCQLLNSLSYPELIEIGNLILKTSSYGYQEGLIWKYQEQLLKENLI